MALVDAQIRNAMQSALHRIARELEDQDFRYERLEEGRLAMLNYRTREPDSVTGEDVHVVAVFFLSEREESALALSEFLRTQSD